MATATFYPDADPESTSVDGYVYHDVGAGGVSWTTLVNAAGTNANDSQASLFLFYIYAATAPQLWRQIWRSLILFDTSTLGAGVTINSATLSLYGNSKFDNLGESPAVNIYSSNPASNTAVVAGDYDSLGSTAFCDSSISYASFSITSYNNFVLNASGVAAISKTGITKFGTRDAVYDVPDSAPSWGANQLVYVRANSAETSGTSTDPKLVVDYTEGAADTGNFFLLF